MSLFYWVFTGSGWISPSFLRVEPSFTGFYRVLLGCTGFYRVLLGFTGFYWLCPCFVGFLPVLVGFDRVSLG